MDGAIPCLVVPFFFGLALFIAWYSGQSQRNRLAELASRLDEGRVLGADDGLFSSLNGARVEGYLGERRVRVQFRVVGSGKNQRTYATFEVRAPNAVATFKVRATNVFNRVGRYIGLVKDVKTGHERIDDKFILEGSARSLRELFQSAPKLEWCLDDLFGKGGHSQVEVRAGRVSSEISAGWIEPLRYLETLRALSRIASLCERREVEIKSEGLVKVLGERKGFAWTYGTSSARCPYCRDEVDLKGPELDACRACNTLHHRECLAEAGGCTVFGCSEAARTRRRA